MSNLYPKQGTLAVLRTAWIVTAIFILSNAATPLYLQWQQNLGFQSGVLGLVFACYIVGLLLTLTVAGQLSDCFGRKALLIPCVGLAIVAAALFYCADSVAMLMLARFLTGISVGLVVSGGMANIVDHAEPHRKHFASLIASTAMVAGAGTGPLLAGAIAQYAGAPIHKVFSIEIGLLLLAMLAVLNQPNHRSGGRGFRLRMPAVPKSSVGVVLTGIAFFGPGLTSTSFVLSLGPKLMSSFLHANSPVVTGGMAFCMFLVAVAVQLLAAKISAPKVFVLSGGSTFFAMMSLWVALDLASAPWLFLAAMLAGAGQGLGQLGGLTLIADNVPSERRAEANAVFNMGGYVPAGAIPVITGYLIDLTGLQSGVTTLTVMIASLAVLALISLKREVLHDVQRGI
jgi:MFS family permease